MIIKLKTKLVYSYVLMLLLSLTPLVYFIAAIVDNKQLYAVKDLIILVILILLVRKSYSKMLYIVIGIFLLINFYALFLSYKDILFYILSVREFLFYPVFGILLGYYLAKNNKFEEYFYNFLLFTFLLIIIYVFIFPYDSFGSTLRLKSFWDREHEPAIVAGIIFIWTIYSNYNKKLKFFVITFSIIIMLLSASRSVLLGVFLVIFLLNIRKISIFKILIMLMILLAGLNLFSKLSLSGRSLDHNLGERTSQYEMAIQNFEKNNFLGMGTDKYGVVGSIQKQYCYNGHCTTTMDSTLIKYTVNYGIIFVLFLFLFLFLLLFYYIHIKNDISKKVFATLVFSLILGAITGKLGAYPLNVLFYMVFGLFIYHLKYIKIRRKKYYEKNIISS